MFPFCVSNFFIHRSVKASSSTPVNSKTNISNWLQRRSIHTTLVKIFISQDFSKILTKTKIVIFNNVKYGQKCFHVNYLTMLKLKKKPLKWSRMWTKHSIRKIPLRQCCWEFNSTTIKLYEEICYAEQNVS